MEGEDSFTSQKAGRSTEGGNAKVNRSDHTSRGRNAIIVIAVGCVWFIFDVVTKRFFNTYEISEVITDPIMGIFRFRLVHNTGAAWGMFDNMTIILGVLSVAICVILLLYLFVLAPRSSVGEALGLALVCAGGIGNALDRFIYGYVIDFIEPTFIDFPVFNLADTGVTCGVVIFIVSLIWRWARNGKTSDEEQLS